VLSTDWLFFFRVLEEGTRSFTLPTDHLSGTGDVFFSLQIVEDYMEIALDSNSLVSTERSFFISPLRSFQTLTKPTKDYFVPGSTVVLCLEQA
jgi:hypothetical protein